MELPKAFDSVNHVTFCSKLEMYGIEFWIASTLKIGGRKRWKMTSLEGLFILKKFRFLRVYPRGPSLTLCCIFLYTNELLDVCGEYIVLYADDTTLIFSEENNFVYIGMCNFVSDNIDRFDDFHIQLYYETRQKGNLMSEKCNFTYLENNV